MLTLTSSDKLLVCKLQSVDPKQIKNKLRMKLINYACFKLEEKATEVLKMIKILLSTL